MAGVTSLVAGEVTIWYLWEVLCWRQASDIAGVQLCMILHRYRAWCGSHRIHICLTVVRTFRLYIIYFFLFFFFVHLKGGPHSKIELGCAK